MCSFSEKKPFHVLGFKLCYICKNLYVQSRKHSKDKCRLLDYFYVCRVHRMPLYLKKISCVDKTRIVEPVLTYSKTTMRYHTRMTVASLAANFGSYRLYLKTLKDIKSKRKKNHASLSNTSRIF